MKERYSYIVLVGISILTAVLAVLYCKQQISVAEHKFCQITHATTAVVVPKPANPAKNPSRERDWEWYQRFVVLNESLGCD